MKRSPFAVLAATAVAAATLTAIGLAPTASAANDNASPVKYHGVNAPFSASADTNGPAIGDVDNGPEIKSPEVEARENSPQGGS